MSSNLTFPGGGRISGNREVVAVVNNVSKTDDITVPATERWLLWAGLITNGDDVARGCGVKILDGTNTIYQLFNESLGAGVTGVFPKTGTDSAKLQGSASPIPLGPGFIIRFSWAAGGASAGGDSVRSALVTRTVK